MPLAPPRSPLARAVLPVAGGLVVLAAIFGATFGISAWISRGGAESTSRLAPTTLSVGDVDRFADAVAEDGPILFPGLATTSGERTLVLFHEGDDSTRGWRLYEAHPDGDDAACGVVQVRGTRRFTDCRGTELDVTGLARPADACPIVDDGRRRLSIGLVASACRADA